MFSQETTIRRRVPGLAVAAVVALAFTAAVLAVALQASSIRSSGVDRHLPRVATEATPTAAPEAVKSHYVSRSCWKRKFGCGQSATSVSISTPSTSFYVSRSCWRRRFGCGQSTTTMSKRP